MVCIYWLLTTNKLLNLLKNSSTLTTGLSRSAQRYFSGRTLSLSKLEPIPANQLYLLKHFPSKNLISDISDLISSIVIDHVPLRYNQTSIAFRFGHSGWPARTQTKVLNERSCRPKWRHLPCPTCPYSTTDSQTLKQVQGDERNRIAAEAG